MTPTRRWRRPLTAAVAVTLATATLAACGSGDEVRDGVALTITQLDGYTDGTSDTAWQQILDECSATTGITIKRQKLPTSQMLPTILRQATAHRLSNLVFVDNPNLQQLAATGALTPVTDYGISTDGYYRSIVEAGTFEGKVYGLAPGVNDLALFYNKTMFTQAGLQPPTTWDELTSTAKALTKGNTYGLSFSAIPTEEGTWQFLPFFWANGGALTDVDSTPGVQALQYVQQLVSDGSASRSVLSWNQTDAANQFLAGQAAMTINGSWNLAAFDQSDIDWGVVPIPAPAAGDATPVALGGEVGIIPRSDDAHQRAAGQVLACVLSDQHQIDWGKAHAYVPARTAAAAELVAQVPDMKTFTDAVPTARSRTAVLGADYPAVSAALIDAVQAALTGTASPQNALANAQRTAAEGTDAS